MELINFTGACVFIYTKRLIVIRGNNTKYFLHINAAEKENKTTMATTTYLK